MLFQGTVAIIGTNNVCFVKVNMLRELSTARKIMTVYNLSAKSNFRNSFDYVCSSLEQTNFEASCRSFKIYRRCIS